MKTNRFGLICMVVGLLVAKVSLAYETFPELPSSDFVEDRDTNLTLAFCSQWDPEFAFRGAQCCNPPIRHAGRRRQRPPRCDPKRAKGHFCDEMTADQKKYIENAKAGKLGDLLNLITRETGLKNKQAYCTVNSGFLVNGRPLVETETNRIRLRAPQRCTEFGTDPLIGMLEWVGRKVAAEYSTPDFAKLRLLIGDITGPRGGCLAGRGGRRGHASHTNGQDVDVGFLWNKRNSAPPDGFTQYFDAKADWWLIKQVFQNPFACVKVVFLDRRLIRQLAKAAAGDPDWALYGKFIKHVKYHRNHFHVRVGDHPGVPGCEAGADPDLEIDEDEEAPHPLDSLGDFFNP